MELEPNTRYVLQLTISDIKNLRVMIQLAFISAGRGILSKYDLLKSHAQSVAVPTCLSNFADVAAELYEMDRPLVVFQEFLESRNAIGRTFVLRGSQLTAMMGLCTNFKYDETCLTYAQDPMGQDALRIINENKEVILLNLRDARPVDEQGHISKGRPMPRINMPRDLNGKPN